MVRRPYYLLKCVILLSGLPFAQAETFPPNFHWCVATSAHQIEGNDRNSDWWNFESLPDKIKNGDKSGRATDHWNRLESDLNLLKQLNINQYRFSIEWAKIEPREGVWNDSAIQHYRAELQGLRALGIRPLVTLNHFTLPQWVETHGGWEWIGIVNAFTRYGEKLYQELGTEFEDVITINEPSVVLSFGYVTGIYPPSKTGIQAMLLPMELMIRAHASLYHALHALAAADRRQIRIGLAHHIRIFDPYGRGIGDRVATKTVDNLFNWSFPDAIETGTMHVKVPRQIDFTKQIPEAKNTEDFFGINYYSRDLIRYSLDSEIGIERIANPDGVLADNGWEIYPKGMTRALRAVRDRYSPKAIQITENGVADSSDKVRTEFMRNHLARVAAAIQEGIPVKGYCHWTLMDDFEWSDGFDPKFGLFQVSFPTLERTARQSAQVFSDIAKHNGL